MTLPNVAYFSMELAIHQSLHTYSGGLGFLAGGHLLSAGRLNLPMIGVSMLWNMGYGDQVIDDDNKVGIEYHKRQYSFLKDTGIRVQVDVFGESVTVKALKLEPYVFGTVPIYWLSTDVPENSDTARQLTDKLYDSDERVRIGQEIILGVGGMRVLQAAHEKVDVVHINEGHALPALFELLNHYGGDLEKVRAKSVFTTHTPVAAGNETHDVDLLAEAGFFGQTSVEEAERLGGKQFSLTVAALRMCRLANGVSQLHGQVANHMWQWVDKRCPIIAITNAAFSMRWQDERIAKAKDNNELQVAKQAMKQELIDYIKEQTDQQLNPETLTIVWARRFTEYKRPTLIFKDLDRLMPLLKEGRIQVVFAGKFHPLDTTGREMFNQILAYTKELPGVAALPNYELDLSRRLKRGADVWLNTPRRPLEASGTSGMSASMNGAVHMTTFDGWAVEGTFHEVNGFVINEHGRNAYESVSDQDQEDYEAMMTLLESQVIPLYYNDKARWMELVRRSVDTVASYFQSDRMAIEYYNRLYKPICYEAQVLVAN